MKEISKKYRRKVLSKLDHINKISKEHQELVLERLKKIKENPDRVSNWDEVSKTLKPFDAKKFNGVLKVNEDALVIQKRLRDEWN